MAKRFKRVLLKGLSILHLLMVFEQYHTMDTGPGKRLTIIFFGVAV